MTNMKQDQNKARECNHLNFTPSTYDMGTHAEYREPKCVECGAPMLTDMNKAKEIEEKSRL